MEDEVTKKFKKFIKPNTVEIVFGIILIVVGIGGLVYGFLSGIIQIGILTLSGGLLFGIVFILWGIIKKNKYKKNLARFEKNGDLPDIVDDFQNGRKMFKDTLILGQYFVIRKNSGTAIEYSEIKKLYQLVKGSGERGKCIIQIQTEDKKKYDLCSVPVHNTNNNDLSRALGYITARNRNIQL